MVVGWKERGQASKYFCRVSVCLPVLLASLTLTRISDWVNGLADGWD
jgi:hypothetical protein